MASPLQVVKDTVRIYQLDHQKIKLFAADQGIVTQSVFRVIVPDVQRYLRRHGIRYACGEAHNHDNGLSHSERLIRTVKELIRFAVLYLLNNPNFPVLGFTRTQIFKLWGELFHWALVVIGLKPCPNVPSKTKYEVFYGRPPDLRDIRLLPIFAVLYVLRTATTVGNPLGINHCYWQRGLYVGPSASVKGAVRVAVVVNGKVQIVTSTRIKAVSDGGDIAPYPTIQRAVGNIIDGPAIDDDVQEDVVDSEAASQPVIVAPEPELEVAQPPSSANRRSRQSGVSVLSTTSGLHQPRSALTASELLCSIQEESNFVDWTRHGEESVYFSFSDNQFIYIENAAADDIAYLASLDEAQVEESCLRAVTVGVPKSFTAALSDPVWGEAARLEFETVTRGSGAIVEVDQQIARENIKNGAEVLRMFAVYEEKIKDGKLVRKVRLVADGRRHFKHGPTYSPTPGREELLVLLHVFEALDWVYYHIDEVRAFLSAPKKDCRPIYAKFAGDSTLREMVHAVYGKRDAPRDYHDMVDDRLINQLGCSRLQVSTCIYVRRRDSNMVIIYDYVDDFVIGGNCEASVTDFIVEFREKANTTEPVKYPPVLLGMELCRVTERHLVLITMKARIQDLCDRFPHAVRKSRVVPMPLTAYIVRQSDVEQLSPRKRRALSTSEVTTYMSIVGSLIWIQGVRLDIIFAVLYLSWNTKAPLQHHMDMAEYCIGYLATTSALPLVLGGSSELGVLTDIDASHGTGPQGRSITGSATKLHESSGAVAAKASAQTGVKLSSFESELDGTTTGLKTTARFNNLLEELDIPVSRKPQLRNDNEAMVRFVQGEGMAKGVRHMELRMFYTREEYRKGKVGFEHTPGEGLVADKLTKLGNASDHRDFVLDIMGLGLLDLKSTGYFGLLEPGAVVEDS